MTGFPPDMVSVQGMKPTIRTTATLLFFGCTLTACMSQSVSNPSPTPFPEMHRTNASATFTSTEAYHIGVGDEIEIKYFSAPELNDMVQVRPDGKISLMFAQDIQAAGKTPKELAASIKKSLDSHVKSDLVVIMRSFGSQKAFVGGEVGKPGSVQLSGGESVLQVLSAAGWITPAGNTNQVLLLRCCNKDGKEFVYLIDIDKVTNGKDIAQNIPVRGGDQILVPPSGVTAFDRWVDQYIRQALPFNTSVGAVFTNQWTNQ